MILHPLRITKNGSHLKISCRVEEEPNKFRELWFSFPGKFESLLSLELDPFAVALLLVAMQKRESIYIKGTISRKLLDGLEKYQRLYHNWYPDRFHMISIIPEGLRNVPMVCATQDPQKIACAFSGGVDSFYTLTELIQNPSLSHLLFMSGFDMPLHLKESISALEKSFLAMADELNLQLIHGSTNVRTFVNTVDWTNSHGQALAASALFFQNSWDAFYIPSSYSQNTYPKWGTHPSLDPLLSTEHLQFIHHGSSLNRVGKLRKISQFPASYSRLRVCWIQDLGLKNCGRCEKCIRTQIALEIIRSRSFFSTFDPSIFSRALVRKLNLRTYQSRLFAKELILEALKEKALTQALDLSVALLRREWFYRTQV